MVTALAISAAVLALLASLPWWLPGRIVALRGWVFARVNGDEGIAVPGDMIGVEHFRDVYSHPAAGGRSRGAALSDLFWYWLSPGAHVHQEHLEARRAVRGGRPRHPPVPRRPPGGGRGADAPLRGPGPGRGGPAGRRGADRPAA
ncbi:hypothetical protein [Actinomadura madurae]|uniref:hypothetical protein n=1 Tax=Actinomadura madurae TaxID=1993 RepID=UPI003555FA70